MRVENSKFVEHHACFNGECFRMAEIKKTKTRVPVRTTAASLKENLNFKVRLADYLLTLPSGKLTLQCNIPIFSRKYISKGCIFCPFWRGKKWCSHFGCLQWWLSKWLNMTPTWCQLFVRLIDGHPGICIMVTIEVMYVYGRLQKSNLQSLNKHKNI